MNYNIDKLMVDAFERNASDIHFTVNRPPVLRINGALLNYGEEILTQADLEQLIDFYVTKNHRKILNEKGEVDFSYVLQDIGRFRINAYRQRKSYCLAIRVLQGKIPSMESLGIAPVVKKLCALKRGLIIITGPAGSGKSTTLASMVDFMNKTRNDHIITIEDPIEYLYEHNKCIINQREVGDDTLSFSNALRASLREDPNIILVGEMRDLETISTAITAAETGHLVISTLHTAGAAQTIDRIIDIFPPSQQQQVTVQLAAVLQGVISQKLIPNIDGDGRVLVQEILLINDAVRNIIRDNKCHTLSTVMQTSVKQGMQTTDFCLAELVRNRKVSQKEALVHCIEPEMIKRYLNVV